VNFTSIEIGSSENDMMIFVGDDNGTVHTVKFVGLPLFLGDVSIDLVSNFEYK